MRPSLILRATQHRTPLIKFIGKHNPPKTLDHTPKPHPASPTHSLPDSFKTYRSKAQQHGPLGGQGHASPFQAPTSGIMTYGRIGGTPGELLGPVEPKDGEYFDRNDLPKRFWRAQWTEEEIEAVNSGGAGLFA
ncbi:hypothetical protein A1O3_09722 [Capronia epimyces CBS 606.96]|uniref:Ribosomal protein S36, mitochondrial n=1 Tax=Capronia epimyces CBS 606.96 TaxID=1182542 RepID=W9XKJ9_9EURO|nr:uncharacterized protein A1O3_09722 [Capronia epimyces CBS 606.96]EXJ77496.1 hypothetical protein A1O3_09722 [Capronia epimyces CBS 606.96]